MSTTGQPLKLNYAKGRQKSKTKNQLQSQQKIPFDGQSSTDIFSHLNQDNLNYIKKQLKHKKASQSQEKSKTLSLSTQQKKESIKDTNHSDKQLKKYDKFKIIDHVKQKLSKQELKKKDNEMSDSIMAESVQETTAPENQRFNHKKYNSQKQRHLYQGLQPPPLTYTTKMKQAPNNFQKQQSKQQDYRIPHNFNHKVLNQPVKNNFLEYELKSETSNNQLAQSSISEEKQSSQELWLHEKGSQFIGYLQSYIEQLNGTSVKKFVRGKESALQNYQNKKQLQREIKNFRKIKEQDLQYQQVQSAVSETSLSHRPISVKKTPDSQNIGFYSRKNQRASILYNSQENASPEQRNLEKSNGKQNESNIEDLKRQLQKQKFYCTKLALQLQKYKQNETKNHKQIILLQKTIDILKIQVENVKQLYQNEAEQTQKILTFFQMQKQKEEAKIRQQQRKQRQERKERQLKLSRQKFKKQPQLNFRQPAKSSFNQPSYTRRYSTHKNQFQEFMKFKDSQKPYDQLNRKFSNLLMQEFKKGQQAYNNEKQTARIKHSKDSTHNFSSTNKYSDQNYLSNKSRSKRYSKNEVCSDKERIYLENLFKLSQKNQQLQKKELYRLKEPISSSSSQEIQREQTSLEKLKRQYGSFKAQLHTGRFQDKTFGQKRSSLKNQISPKEFSQIFVK